MTVGFIESATDEILTDGADGSRLKRVPPDGIGTPRGRPSVVWCSREKCERGKNMDNVSNIDTERIEREIFDNSCFHTLFDLTQELNAVWHAIHDKYGKPQLYVKNMKRHIEEKDLAALAYMLNLHAANMQGLSSDISGMVSEEDAWDRAKEMADEFVERPEPAIVNKYITAYCEALEACLLHQEEPDKDLLPWDQLL